MMDAQGTEASHPQRADSPADKLLQALEVMQDGFAVKRANLRRQYPDESEEQVDARLTAWMADG